MDVNLTTKLPRGFVVSSVTPQAQPDECCSREFMDMRWSVGPSQRIQEHGIIFTDRIWNALGMAGGRQRRIRRRVVCQDGHKVSSYLYPGISLNR